MKIGNQIIRGMFEFSSQHLYTKGDVVLHDFYNSSGVQIVRLYMVVAEEVTGILPSSDISETYFVDYFKQAYTYDPVTNQDPIVTKSTIQTYISEMITGLGPDGYINPHLISIEEIPNIHRTGFFKITNLDSDRNLVVLKGVQQAVAIMYEYKADNELPLNYLAVSINPVNTSTNKIMWEGYTFTPIAGDMNKALGYYYNKLLALEVFMMEQVRQATDFANSLS